VEEQNLPAAVASIRALGMRGVNVTIPFKEKVIPYLDECSQEAKACGAVNLIENDGKRLIGHNMDGQGFLASLREAGVDPEGKAVILGAGGAARAVAYSLSQQPNINVITFVSRNRANAQKLADFIANSTSCSSDAFAMEDIYDEKLSSANMVVNCTPVGMFPGINKAPLASMDGVNSDALIFDTIYNPMETEFMKMGKARGMKTIGGLSMLIHQGALSFSLLTGIEPPISFMVDLLSEYFRREQSDKNF
ncbi:MAG: shikimate dehydrogenase, partial [Bacillota bacterium]|nr:shikimate dehydrogenase [Bacillota bacterium]